MPNRIDQKFAELRARGGKGFIAYICAGDPDLNATKTLALTLEKCGVDILELGVPFSDPLADGIVNQMAAQRALEAGTTVHGVLDCVQSIRKQSQIPIVLYTYMNPIFRFGFDKFHAEAEAAGVDGLLILDLPPDESAVESVHAKNLKRIRLIAPTTPPERMAQIMANADGFVYYVSREGVTGEQATVPSSLASQVAEIRRTTKLPIAVGFGISTPEQAHEVAQFADAVVVGSAIVKRIAAHGRGADLMNQVRSFVEPLVRGAKQA